MEEATKTGRARRQHSDEFKAHVVADCRRPGASISGIALAHGLNANVVRRWLKERPAASVAPILEHGAWRTQDKFVPVTVEAPTQLKTPAPPPKDIQIELSRGPATIVVRWPTSEAGSCAAWLREWLR